MTAAPSNSPAQPPPALIVAFILGGALILGFGFWSGGRERGSKGAADAAPPGIVLIEPGAGAVHRGAVPLLFETTQSLRLTPAGWGAGDAHLHAMVDGVELMAGRGDLEEVGPRRYQWTLRRLEPGSHEIRLFWSGADHRPLPDGASAAVVVEIR